MSCNGQGTVYSSVKETINIPKGVDNGVNLRMSKKGNQTPKGDSGDLLIKVNVRPHPYLKREGFDIIAEKYISVTQAILGGSIKIDTLNGKKDITLQPGIVHGQKLRL